MEHQLRAEGHYTTGQLRTGQDITHVSPMKYMYMYMYSWPKRN